MNRVYVAADHRGFELKEKIKEWLTVEGYDVVDEGNWKYDMQDDFPDYTFGLAEKVVTERAKGVVVCGSGVGAAIAANKVAGVRAGLCTSEDQARKAREDDDINILCLSSVWVAEEVNKGIVTTFLMTQFSSIERYIRRINKIKDYESTKNG